MSGKQVPPDLEAAWQSFQQQSNKPATKKTSSKKREIKLEDTPLELNAVDHAVNNATIQLQPQMEAREALIAKKARVEGEEEAIVPFRQPVTREQYQIISMEAHNRRDNQVELFEHNINKYHTPSSVLLLNPPPKIDPLGFALRYPNEFPWAPITVNAVANNPSIGFPRSPPFSREYIKDYLRPPSKIMTYERECINLDRDPLAHETLDICAAFELSTKLAGPGNGFKLREFLVNNEMERILEHLENKRTPPPGSLSEVRDLCFMCHLRHVYRLCLAQIDDEKQRKRKDLTTESRPNVPMYSIFNRFTVITDMEGEYRRGACISYDHVSVGLSGPFPRWNPNNFILNGRSFVEVDDVVFRHARVSQELDGSKTHGATACTPTSLTTAVSRKAVCNSRN
jgi:hypothetical protein